MRSQRFVIGLVALNLLLIVLVAAQGGASRTASDVIRGRALELVDQRGQVRATIIARRTPTASTADGRRC